MRVVAVFDPSQASSDTFNAGFSSGQGRIVVWNESSVNLQLSWGSFSTYCPAWMGNLYCLDVNNVNITWSQQSILNASGAPASQVIVEAYDAGECIDEVFPVALTRQFNIGNQVNTVSGSATNIQNDGNAGGTQFIESTPTGASSSTVSFDNNGNVTIKGNNSGVLTTLLQLIAGGSPAVQVAALNVLTTMLGGLTVNQNLSVVGTTRLDNGKITSDGSGDLTCNGASWAANQDSGFDSTGIAYIKQNNTSTPSTVICGTAGLGLKMKNGTKLFEMQSGGNFIIKGNTYYTTTSQFFYSAGASFDSFDLAELYPVAEEYEDGTVVCPGDDDTLHLCTHEGCAFAMVVSLSPAFCAGGGVFSGDEPIMGGLPIALCGRVKVQASEAIGRRVWVASDGGGHVRAARPGDYAIGFCLSDGDGAVAPILLRGNLCK